jgi:hypothetical protein
MTRVKEKAMLRLIMGWIIYGHSVYWVLVTLLFGAMKLWQRLITHLNFVLKLRMRGVLPSTCCLYHQGRSTQLKPSWSPDRILVQIKPKIYVDVYEHRQVKNSNNSLPNYFLESIKEYYFCRLFNETFRAIKFLSLCELPFACSGVNISTLLQKVDGLNKMETEKGLLQSNYKTIFISPRPLDT